MEKKNATGSGILVRATIAKVKTKTEPKPASTKKPNWRNQQKKVAWRNQDTHTAKNDDARDDVKEQAYSNLFSDYELGKRNSIRNGGFGNGTGRTRKPRGPVLTQSELNAKVAQREAATRARARTMKIKRDKQREISNIRPQKPVKKHDVVVISKYKPDPELSFPQGPKSVQSTQPKSNVVSDISTVTYKRGELPTATRKPRAKQPVKTNIRVAKTIKKSVPNPHPLDRNAIAAIAQKAAEEIVAEKMKNTQRRRMPRPMVETFKTRPDSAASLMVDEDFDDFDNFDEFEDDLDNFDDGSDTVDDLDASDIE